uniref:primosomal protein N' n=1 Tax=Actinomycetospora lemnae TaxID=3019891 RepID=UPI0038CC17F2
MSETGEALFAAPRPVEKPDPPAKPAPTPTKPAPAKKPHRNERLPAAERPVATVAVDVNLAHLDRTFDYQVPEQLAADAVPGARVRVRFAGRLVDGFVLAREETSEHDGRLGWLEKVVSPEPVLGPELAGLCRAVADRYAGTLADVLRLAVPPRHARVEAETPPERPEPRAPAQHGWGAYPRGPALLEALAAGRGAHAVWQALPGEDWPARLAEAAATTAAGGRSAVLVVPDRRDLDRVQAACEAVAGADAVVALAADLGPAERYRRWLAVARGDVRIVVGTRATAFAPVRDPGLIAVWDDGDDSHAEPRAPYPHARDVAMTRAHRDGAALLVAGFARTAEAALLVASGWAHDVVADRTTVRARGPRVTAIGEDDRQLLRDPAARAARMPSVAFEAARAALTAGAPVLVQVPRRGYLPAVACGNCREPARCRRCAGPLALPSHGDAAAPTCRWCGHPDPAYRCGACGSPRLRALAVGSERTAEELGRSFPQTVVRTSGGGSAVLDHVPASPALVVATPGAEPVAEGGYGAALLLDGAVLLARPELRAGEETLRRWFGAAALVRPAPEGGRVVVMADSSNAAVQALVRWDPVGHAATELAARTDLALPPAMRMAAVDGPPPAVADLLAALPATVEVLGPVELPPGTKLPGAEERTEGAERCLVRVPRTEGRTLARELHAAQAVRSARKEREPVRVLLDPLDPL